MYHDGVGVDKNLAEAIKLYQMAAEQGSADAQNTIGSMYEHGEGVNKDFAEAAKWYRLAADQGEAVADRARGIDPLLGAAGCGPASVAG